jgi:uncharacterized protein YjbI with pentapeptide repeats
MSQASEVVVLNVLNTLSFKFACLPGRLGFPCHSLTLIVKGTFDLSSGDKASAAEEQAFPTGDEYYPDDDEMTGSLRYESDFAHFKPRSDLLLVGNCHPPGGKPAEICPVTFQVGTKSRTLTVSGNRCRRRLDSGWIVTEPEPFAEMELRWENSFGGDGFKQNPVGKGFIAPGTEAGVEDLPLANIECPADARKPIAVEPEPAGFGPLARMWQTRLDKMGTYTGTYRETRWPWFPEDFDWSHFNAAPEEMQVDGYLRGDEELYFENLHPVHSAYRCRLPGLRVRCFLNKQAGAQAETRFDEIPMNLDTLWVDMAARKLVLLWRGWAEVLSEDYQEVRDVFIMSEPLEQQPAPVEVCYQLFLDKMAEEEMAWAPASEEPAAEEEQPGESPDPGPRLDPEQLKAQSNALLAQMGIDVDNLPPKFKEQQTRLFQKIVESDPEKLAAIEHLEHDAEMRESLGKLGLDPDHLPPLSEKASQEQVRLLGELGIKDSEFSALPEIQRLFSLMAAVLPKAGMNPEDLSPLIELTRKHLDPFKKQFGVEEKGDDKTNEAPVLTREIVQQRAASGESFAGKNLKGLDLSGLDLKEIDFFGAILAGANLTNADLRSAILLEADLSGANLSGANLAGVNGASANLSKANLEKARLQNADLTQSNLSSAKLSDSVLTGAVCENARLAAAALERVDAKDAIFHEADLSGAVFRDAALQGADLSKCLLHNTNFQNANLTEASVEGAAGHGINFSRANLTALRASEGCDFTGGTFCRIQGARSIWEKANLTQCDFRYARMEGATFTAACLKQANLSAADMKFSRFNKANLSGAKVVQTNLFEANLERADLTEADLSGSNMYGAEFLDAVIERTEMNETNLKMTKLHTK